MVWLSQRETRCSVSFPRDFQKCQKLRLAKNCMEFISIRSAGCHIMSQMLCASRSSCDRHKNPANEPNSWKKELLLREEQKCFQMHSPCCFNCDIGPLWIPLVFVNFTRTYSGICGWLWVVPDLPPHPAKLGQDSMSVTHETMAGAPGWLSQLSRNSWFGLGHDPMVR